MMAPKGMKTDLLACGIKMPHFALEVNPGAECSTSNSSCNGFLALLFVGAGANHFVHADFYANIIPPYLPWHLTLVYVSGVFEVVLGVLLLIPKVTPSGGLEPDRAADCRVPGQHSHGFVL